MLKGKYHVIFTKYYDYLVWGFLVRSETIRLCFAINVNLCLQDSLPKRVQTIYDLSFVYYNMCNMENIFSKTRIVWFVFASK